MNELRTGRMLGSMGESRVRRTVSLDADVAVAMDVAVANGEADTISGLMEDAIRAWLRSRERERLAADAARLDATSDTALVTGATGHPVWSGLRAR